MDNRPAPAVPANLLALSDPQTHGYPTDPRLRLPILARIRKGHTPDTQALARAIWDTFPLAFQEEVRETMGWTDLEPDAAIA